MPRHAVGVFATAFAGGSEDDTIWITQINQNISVGNYSDVNSCWFVQLPTGSSDFFSLCFKVAPGIPNVSTVADGLPVTGIGLSMCLPGGIAGTLPRIGVYYPSSLSPCTPDLTNPVFICSTWSYQGHRPRSSCSWTRRKA